MFCKLRLDWEKEGQSRIGNAFVYYNKVKARGTHAALGQQLGVSQQWISEFNENIAGSFQIS